MESEMVLLVMLPDEDRVMLVQTPRLRTIADLEDFIVDEYSRVFPHVPALSRDLRIQKCVSPELVVDRRSYTTVRQQAPHSFVDLAKNVQVGNVFQNMEQIYIVLNKKFKKSIAEGPRKQQVPQKLPIVDSNVQAETGAESKQKQQAVKKGTMEAPRKQQALKKSAAVAKIGAGGNKTAGKEVQDGKKEKEQEVSKRPSVVKKPQDTKEMAAGDVTKDGTEENHDSTNASNDVKKIAVAETYEKKIDWKQKSKKAATKEKRDAKNENKSDLKLCAAGTNENTLKKTPKKIGPKKSENVLLKKMLAAKHNASQPGAALVVNSLQNTGAPKVPLKNEQKRKANEQDVALAEGTSASDALEPLTKKKKTVKNSDDKMSKAVEDEVAVANSEKSAKKTAAQDKIQKTTKKKATTTTKSELKTDEDSSTASECTPSNRKLKQNIADDVEEPVVKRAKTEVLPKAIVVKKAAEEVKRVAKLTTPESDTSASSSSQSFSSSATQEDEIASGEETAVIETSATKKATKSNEKPKEISEQKSGFQKIMADTTKRIADEKKAKDAKLMTTVTPEKRLMQTPKSAESTASESSSDSDQPPVVVKVAKHSRKNATPVEGSSSSFSEEEELDYSQSLLADLTKNDTDEEEVVPVVFKKGKKSKQNDWRDNSQSQDMPSSKLTQKSQESSSVLLPPLSQNRFSLGSMPVAKLKKSSKNPFSSPKKVKAKGKTSNATDCPRGRPRK